MVAGMKPKLKQDPIAALVREMDWGTPWFETELLARLFEGELVSNVIPSAGTSGMRVIAALVKLVRHVAARGDER